MFYKASQGIFYITFQGMFYITNQGMFFITKYQKGALEMAQNSIDYEKLDLYFLRGEIPTSIYCQLNNKSAQFNYELQRQEFFKLIDARQKEIEDKKKAEEAQQAMIDEAQKQIEKQLPNVLDKAMNDILKGFK